MCREVHWSLEQPGSSLMYRHRRFQEMCAKVKDTHLNLCEKCSTASISGAFGRSGISSGLLDGPSGRELAQTIHFVVFGLSGMEVQEVCATE